MYGYVRPVKGEMKISDFDRYRGYYCGLCHRLRRRYGPVCRFLVNYDFTFLAMLLSEDTGEEKLCRCPYHPLRKGACCPVSGDGMDAAADHTVILAWWKLRDGIADSGFSKALGCRLACVILRRHYKKAAGLRPGFDDLCREQLRSLASLEAERSPVLDAAADCFARILRGAGTVRENGDRVAGELLYHLGRIIYILDAADDLAEDAASGRYNPLMTRYGVSDRLSPEQEQELRLSLQHSRNSMSSAFALLDRGCCTPILENIIYLGLPAVTQSIFSGQWKNGPRRETKRSRI